jgi:hypothetical protein
MTRARDLAAFVSNADGDVKFDTDTLFIDSSANRVGIGSTSPSSALHVEGDATTLTLRDDSSYSAGTGPYLQFQGLDSGGTNRNFAQIAGLSNGSNSGDLIINTRNSGTTAERIRVKNDGSVGIGTNSPSVPLHVNGGTENIVAKFESSDADSLIQFADNSTSDTILMGASTDDLLIRCDPGNIIFKINNNTEGMRLLAAGGLTFNGDTAAANALDDYEEGTWTPQWSSSGYTFGYSENAGLYTKVGRLVHVMGRIDINSVSGSAGNAATITGLPFTTNSTTACQGGMTPMQAQWGSATARLMIYIGSNRDYLAVYDNAFNSNYVTLKGDEIGSNDSIIFTLSYQIS